MEQILEMARRAGDTINACTLWPWVITATYTTSEQYGLADTEHTRLPRTHVVIKVVEATHADAPDGLDMIPVEATAVRVDVLPAARFDDMPRPTRVRYRQQYQAYLMWRRSKVVGKPVELMAHWVDYDPIYIDESVRRWLEPGVRYTGD